MALGSFALLPSFIFQILGRLYNIFSKDHGDYVYTPQLEGIVNQPITCSVGSSQLVTSL